MSGYTIKIVFCLFVFVSFFHIQAYAIKTDFTASMDSRHLWVEARLRGSNQDEISAALGDGLKSEIVFQFRIYRKNRGFFSFTGDVLVLEKKLTYVAYKDFFKNIYIIQNESGYSIYSGEGEFFEQFLKCSLFLVTLPDSPDPSDYTVLARITINPVKLEPPLHIVSLITSIGTTTEWAEFPLAGAVK
jgi:hypothetical protein